MSQHSQFDLLRERRFAPFFASQFLGAFNDNVFKNALAIMITYQGATLAGLDSKSLVMACTGLFILPYFLVSATAGQLADKYEKSMLIQRIKLLEIVIMLIGAYGFFAHHLPLLLLSLFLLGVQATLFGPVKYSILPQHLKEEELVGGNGLVESGTFVAILAGTILGGILIAQRDTGPALVAGVCIAAAIFGYLASRAVPSSPADAPELRVNWNMFSETWRNIQFARRNRAVFLSLMGISWFWFYGAVLLSQFPAYAKEFLHGDESVATLLLAVLSIGIGAGSLLCERLSGDKVELGLVPFGSIGLTVFAADLYFTSTHIAPPQLLGALAFAGNPAHWRVLADLLLIGIFSGFYTVPLYALLQTRSEPTHRARIIAANNILNALFMVIATIATILFFKAGLNIIQLFLVTALLNAAVALYIYLLLPEFLMRFIVWMLIHSIYRLKKEGLQNIPDSGPAVLVCNHVSFVDALIIAAACRRPVRFVMDHQIFHTPIMKFVFRTGRAIPIASSKEDPALLERAYDDIAIALQEGDVVCIFPEGKITYDGQMNPFRGGIKRIIDRSPVPVIPLALRGLWGSLFSRKYGTRLSRFLPRRLFAPVELMAGAPVAASDVVPDDLHARVLGLRGSVL